MPDYQALLPQFAPLDTAQVAAVFQASLYLQEQLVRHPEWIANLIHSQAYASDELYQTIQHTLANVPDETHLLKQVRLIRHRETVRIAWRDLMNLAP